MRTSNKILLAGFFTTLLILVGIHVVLYAKIKGGDLVEFKNRSGYNMQEQVAFNHIKHIYIRGMEECLIIPSDSVKLEMSKDWKGIFGYRVAADTLFIEAKLTERDYENGLRIYVPIIVYVEPGISVSAADANLYFQGSAESVNEPSLSIDLNNTSLHLTAINRQEPVANFDSLDIHCSNKALIEGLGKGTVKKLHVTLDNNSQLNDRGTIFETVTLNMDSTSSATLRAFNLKKIKLD